MGSADAQLASARAAATRADADVHKAETRPWARRDAAQGGRGSPGPARQRAIALDVARAAKAQAEAQMALAADSRRGAASRVVEARGRVDQSAPVAPQIAAARAGAALAARAGAQQRGGAGAGQAAARLHEDRRPHRRLRFEADGARRPAGHGRPAFGRAGPDDTYVVANFKETQIGQMHAGAAGDDRGRRAPGARSSTGRVESLSGGTGASFSLLPPDNATGNFVKVVQRVPVRIAWVRHPRRRHCPSSGALGRRDSRYAKVSLPHHRTLGQI